MQTELISVKGKRVVSILLADGAVIGRYDREWLSTGEGQVLEQRRVSNYHERLLRAIKRLQDEQNASIDELKRLFDRLAGVALRLSRSTAVELLSSIPSALWMALASKEGKLIDSAPADCPGENWCLAAAGLRVVAGDISVLFGSGGASDIVMRTEHGYILITPHQTCTLATGTESGRLPEIRGMLKVLLKEEADEKRKESQD